MRRIVLLLLASVTTIAWGCHDVDEFKPCDQGTVRIGATCVKTPSCTTLPETCGESGSDSCCRTDPVDTTDAFFLGYDEGSRQQGGVEIDGFQADRKTQVRLSKFWLDRFEITVGRFRKFLDDYDQWHNLSPRQRDGNNPNRLPQAGGGAASSGADAWIVSWRENTDFVAPSRADIVRRINQDCGIINGTPSLGKWTDAPGPNENMPMTCLSWFEAFEFCIWDGARLPSEAEWSYAAAGGKEQRAFPWSTPPSSTTIDDSFAAIGPAQPDLAEVGKHHKGASRFGQEDLAGNAYEWVMDSPKDVTTFTVEPNEPMDLSGYDNAAPERAVRGGSFKFGAPYARTTYRQKLAAVSRYRDVGARCARPSGQAF